MRQNTTGKQGRWRGFLVGGAALIYFIAALEIVIMISPFAFFFYSAFNPILLGLNQSSLTRWLTAFFLPHMIVPPTPLLIGIRVLGSVLFIGGSLLFIVCAAQVYLGKILKWGVASRGFYRVMRHPQYLGLALAGLGLTILWPRFLTLMFLAVMIFLYYLLAKDEERRMLGRYGETYQSYLERTGMFWPRFNRKPILAKPLKVKTALFLLAALLGGASAVGFGLRAYTVAHLPLKTVDGVDVLTILPSDLALADDLFQSMRSDPVASGHLSSMRVAASDRILAYVVPTDYVMQGMIANTGEEWMLFRRHQTLAMIADYVLHPKGHLQSGRMPHNPQMHNNPMLQRRIIFLEVRSDRPLKLANDDFRINNIRLPRYFIDIHLHTKEVLQVQDTPRGTGWGDVPTPMF